MQLLIDFIRKVDGGSLHELLAWLIPWIPAIVVVGFIVWIF